MSGKSLRHMFTTAALHAQALILKLCMHLCLVCCRHVEKLCMTSCRAAVQRVVSVASSAVVWSGRDQQAKLRLIEGLPQPGGRSKIGPMAAKKLVGLLTAEDPMTAMDSFAV